MPTDFYNDGPPEAAEPEAKETTETKGQTALLPKSFFSETPEPGAHLELDVVRVHDEEVEVRLSSEAEEEQEEGGESNETMSDGEAEPGAGEAPIGPYD